MKRITLEEGEGVESPVSRAEQQQVGTVERAATRTNSFSPFSPLSEVVVSLNVKKIEGSATWRKTYHWLSM
uniref:Uncharacterized protein n=1 Tax=Timema genevievae TaxID=629358 RepID=A0A7R9K8S9_TIMGE|nr:unnamed protein product [Timema genevievae]